MATATTAAATTEESNELQEFRRQWIEEVRRGQQSQRTPLQRQAIRDEAVRLYYRGMELEQQEQLTEAITFYRRAMRLDHDVEEIVHAQQRQRTQEQQQPHKQQHKQQQQQQPFAHPRLPHHYDDHYERQLDDARVDPVMRLLAGLSLSSEPAQAAPDADGALPVAAGGHAHISTLPSELLVRVFSHLVPSGGAAALARVSHVCRHWYAAAQDPALWHALCEHAWGPDMALAAAVAYRHDWKRMLMDRPRIRFDGVYISTIKYIREGHNDGGHYNPLHIVTYYRYLRFLDDERVLCLLSSDEPSSVVAHLRDADTALKAHRNCLVGTYVAEETPEYAVLNVTIGTRAQVGRYHLRYTMELELRSTYPGGNNKMSITRYYSRDAQRPLDDPDVTLYDNKKNKPFMFSRVRSYAAAAQLQVAA